MNRRKFIATSSLGAASSLPFFNTAAAPQQSVTRIGIIGLDTSHSPAFAKYFNVTEASKRFRVVAAYPHGSATIESSVSRIPKITEEVKSYGVTIVDSIEKLFRESDVILLETNDGTLHKQQAFAVLNARKPMFIDKPVAHTIGDVRAIYARAGELNVPVFSSSSLRYMKTCQRVRHEKVIGDVLGADCFSPASIEPSHSDLFWYGIHGVETLYTVMGTGCESVRRIYRDNSEVTVGVWLDGRIGTFRGTREGKHDYGGTAYGSNGNLALGPFDGYDGLAEKIAGFFTTKQPPVDAAETLEIYTFMAAAEESKKRGGAPIRLDAI
jgi:hypothetical protein